MLKKNKIKKQEQEEGLLRIENFLVENNKLDMKDETFEKLMFFYSSAMKEMETKISIMKEEYELFYHHTLVDHMKMRIKTPESIVKKMKSKKKEMTYKNLIESINDIAGIRIICPMKDDIFAIRDWVESMQDVQIVKEKDYVTYPKKSGYSSYHLIVEVPVTVAKQLTFVKVEIQIRTLAMDFWASLEHDMKYKADGKVNKTMSKELIACAKAINKLDNKMVTIGSSQKSFF